MSIIPYIVFVFVIVLIGIVISLKRIKNKTKKPIERPFKKYGVSVIVDLNDCMVRSKEYYELVEPNTLPSRIDMLNSMVVDKNREEKIKKVVSEISCQINEGEWKGLYKSIPIYLSETDIRYRMLDVKSTILYIDPLNKRNYHLDVDFIFNRQV